MSLSISTNRRAARAVVVVALAVALAAAAWVVRAGTAESAGPAAAAAPVTARVGTLSLATSSNPTLDVQGFSFGASMATCVPGSGGCVGGKANVDAVNVTLASGPTAPELFQTLVTGKHLQRATLVLFKPNSTKRAQEYVFQDVVLSSWQTSAGVPNNKDPMDSLSLTFRRVNHRVYNPGTDTVLGQTCWDVAQNAGC